MDVQDGLDLYTRMCFLRHFEERADVLYRRGLIHGPVHLGLGHEAIAVGAAAGVVLTGPTAARAPPPGASR